MQELWLQSVTLAEAEMTQDKCLVYGRNEPRKDDIVSLITQSILSSPLLRLAVPALLLSLSLAA